MSPSAWLVVNGQWSAIMIIILIEQGNFAKNGISFLFSPKVIL
jgi:hypothetical protein